jgi:hypothetical protein
MVVRSTVVSWLSAGRARRAKEPKAPRGMHPGWAAQLRRGDVDGLLGNLGVDVR